MTKILEKKDISEKLDITDPFLMIDSFEIVDPGKIAKGYKKLSNDWFFDCHLPNSQAMPATLQIEGMLQTLVLLIYATEDHGDQPALINNVNVKLLSQVKPDQELVYEAELLSFRRGIAKGQVIGFSGNEKICQGEFTYASPHLMLLPRISKN